MPRVALVNTIRTTFAAALVLDAEVGGAGILVTAPRLRDLPQADLDVPPTEVRQLDLSTPEIEQLERFSDVPPYDLVSAILQFDAVVRDVALPLTAATADPAAFVLERLGALVTIVEPKVEELLGNLESAAIHPALAPSFREAEFVSYAEVADVGGERLHARGTFRYSLELLVERTVDASAQEDFVDADVDYDLHEGGVKFPDDPHAQDRVVL
ncbi:MAG: hypothetical protein V3S03_08365 [Vicinamibacteria bacterium]